MSSKKLTVMGAGGVRSVKLPLPATDRRTRYVALLPHGCVHITEAVLGVPTTDIGAGDGPVFDGVVWFGVTPVGLVGVRIVVLPAGGGAGAGAGGTASEPVGVVAISAGGVLGAGAGGVPVWTKSYCAWLCTCPREVFAITVYT